MDAARALTGQVRDVNGNLLTLVRPGGFEWETTAEQCWTASPEERQSLTPRGAMRIITTNGVHEVAKHGGSQGGDPSDGSGPAK
ncbi:hypothetical protein [Streptomyces sp. NPDC048623]|uniref:hypothetical protein n=1 Tax=Streptomyces sp. NPDC048623 TaxID=3155761 RepID=UPI003428633D